MIKKKVLIIAMLIVAMALLVSSLTLNGTSSVLAQDGDDAATTEETTEETAVTQDGVEVEPIDHAEIELLQQEFATGPEVTAACLTCHEDAAHEIMGTAHWTWEYTDPENGDLLGKANVINNFCVAIDSNEPRCTSCHAGYGWTDKTFDFEVETNVDCLVCHDTTGTYKKFPTGAGHPTYVPKEFPPGSGKIWQPPDLSFVAQNIGATSRETCGACHFYGGGADGVKHGDMDSSLKNPSVELDVHMSPEGEDMSCTDCHTSEGHVVSGSRYSMNSTDEETCESCHEGPVHEFEMLNDHIDSIACQTCHIPEYARGGVPTKMEWDWSQAGQLDENGKFIVVKDESGHSVYDGRKGAFVLGEDVEPVYIWFNGDLDYTLLTDEFDPADAPIVINAPGGSREDLNSRIWPMKQFEATQPYDSVYNNLVVPHLFGKDDAAYWKNFDWATSIQAGMDYVTVPYANGESVPYSGEYGFIETTMFWPITHMVPPASEALDCDDCHAEEGGRLDFIALGYDEDAAYRLTHFPPTLEMEAGDMEHQSPNSCIECHENEHADWDDSAHGEAGVSCIICHQLEGEGIGGVGDGPSQHPTLPYSINKEADLCGTCHINEYNDWEMSGHNNIDENIACVDCHIPHTQQQRIEEGNTNTCESCHEDQIDEVSHSTHGAVEMDCLDCHKNTHENTGHSFFVGSDTCNICHSADIHTSSMMVDANLELSVVEDGQIQGQEAEETEEDAMHEDAATEQIAGASTGILAMPQWVLIIPAIFVVIGGVWVVKGNDPGHQHEENKDQD